MISMFPEHGGEGGGMLSVKKKYYLILLSPLLIAPITLFIGRYPVSFPLSDPERFVLLNIRLPRILLCMMTGAGLSVAGASLQSTLRNPLASPYILGVSQGAAFGAALAMVVLPYSMYLLPASAFVFAFLAITFTCLIARIHGEFSTVAVILSGVIVAGIFTALLSIVKLFSDPYRLSGIVFWMMGGFYRAYWDDILIAAPGFIVGIMVLFSIRWRLNVLSIGNEEARMLGVNVKRDTMLVIFFSALICASVISVVGIVAWIGLIIPQMVRGMLGADNRHILPASAAFGAGFLLIVDTICRTLYTFEIPISIITTLIAAPYFIYLLRKIGGSWR